MQIRVWDQVNLSATGLWQIDALTAAMEPNILGSGGGSVSGTLLGRLQRDGALAACHRNTTSTPHEGVSSFSALSSHHLTLAAWKSPK